MYYTTDKMALSVCLYVCLSMTRDRRGQYPIFETVKLIFYLKSYDREIRYVGPLSKLTSNCSNIKFAPGAKRRRYFCSDAKRLQLNVKHLYDIEGGPKAESFARSR